MDDQLSQNAAKVYYRHCAWFKLSSLALLTTYSTCL
uniref:Uncharacterized protein n=1 Tax=Arundo donax TaxID=35708 RepID=A0A0A9B924_ARUDO